MNFSFYLFGRDDAFDDSFFIDDKSCAERSHVFPSVHGFFSPYTKLFYQFFVSIGY